MYKEFLIETILSIVIETRITNLRVYRLELTRLTSHNSIYPCLTFDK